MLSEAKLVSAARPGNRIQNFRSIQLVFYNPELKYWSRKIKKEKLDSLRSLFLKTICLYLILFSRMNTFNFESKVNSSLKFAKYDQILHLARKISFFFPFLFLKNHFLKVSGQKICGKIFSFATWIESLKFFIVVLYIITQPDLEITQKFPSAFRITSWNLLLREERSWI